MGEHQVQKQHRRPSSKSPRALFLLPSQGALAAPTQLSHLSSEPCAVHMLHREATWRTQSTLPLARLPSLILAPGWLPAVPPSGPLSSHCCWQRAAPPTRST